MRKHSRLFLLTSISILIFYSLSCLPNSDQTNQDPPRDRQPPPPGNNRMGRGPDQEREERMHMERRRDEEKMHMEMERERQRMEVERRKMEMEMQKQMQNEQMKMDEERRKVEMERRQEMEKVEKTMHAESQEMEMEMQAQRQEMDAERMKMEMEIMTQRQALDIEMQETVLEGEVVTVEVNRLAQKKDQTGTIKNISGDEINALPVENVGAVVNMQAGVVTGHFRGGRNTEVTYMIDGVQVDEAFGGGSATVEIQPEAVQDLEVITGTFNAEYGRAMSCVFNVVTKEGGPKFEGFYSFGFSSFSTNNSDIFVGISPEINNSQDLKFNLGGPILGDKVTFFTNFRSQRNLGHLNGYRIFQVDDYSNFYSDDSLFWYSEKSGDSSYVPMNTGENLSALL